MSGTTDKDGPPIPPKERSPSPDDGLLREEPLELESKPITKDTTSSATNPTITAPSTTAQTDTTPPAPAVEEENPPPKPPRPVSQFDRNVATLAEAFPDIDLAVIKAVLSASGGVVEPAFNALLGMSDPSVAAELEIPPPQPPRPRQQVRDFGGDEHYNPAGVYHDHKTSTSASQLEADEIYARQLAERYGGVPRQKRGRGGYGNHTENRRRKEVPEEEEDKERSFLDDDLPVIRENIRKGFLETQTKVNKFISDFSKKFTNDEDETTPQQGGPRQQGGQQQQYPQRYSSRRPGDAYDADPEVLQGDFSHLELRDNVTDETRRNRPIANPNLFGSNTSPQATAPGQRKVGFASQSEEDLYRKPPASNTRSGPPHSALRTSSPGNTTGGSGGTAGSKWEPLATVEPTPLNNDPFSLADSDDEHDGITTTAAKTGPQETGTKSNTK